MEIPLAISSGSARKLYLIFFGGWNLKLLINLVSKFLFKSKHISLAKLGKGFSFDHILLINSWPGSFPHECYGLYESDYEHFDEYTKMLKETNLKGLEKYLDKYIYNPDTFNDFLNIFSVKKIIERIQSGKEICNA